MCLKLRFLESEYFFYCSLSQLIWNYSRNSSILSLCFNFKVGSVLIKLFWKTGKPDFTDKTFKDDRIILIEDGKIISEESEIAKLFNNYLKIWLDLEWPEIFQEYNSAVENSIQKFENHTCIVKIESSIRRTEKFPFTFLNTDEIKKETGKLDAFETSQMLDTN